MVENEKGAAYKLLFFRGGKRMAYEKDLCYNRRNENELGRLNMQQVPENLKRLLQQQYGLIQMEQILQGYSQQRPVTLRINTLKTDEAAVQAELRKAGIEYVGVPWNKQALIIQGVREPELRRLALYEQGHIYLQSLSSMLPPLLLRPQEHENILDMAAAPGGKTTQIAALTHNKAQITACEKNRIRAERLAYNVEKQGVKGVYIMQTDASRLDALFSFDRILLDAPCSGSGTISVQQSRISFSAELLARSVKAQQALLHKALQILKPGGEMIYSTCSILEQENEQILAQVLKSGQAELLPVEEGWTKALPQLPTTLPGTLCVCPDAFYEGFFVARLRRRRR